MMKVKSNNIVRNLAEVKDLCNPNLLLNADFNSGIINQRGQTTYTGSGLKYTIDMWRRRAGTLTVGTNSITFTNSGSIAIGLEQVIDIDAPITIYIKANVKQGQARLSLFGSLEYGDDLLNGSADIVTGENVFHLNSGNVKIFQIIARANSSIEIESVKVEQGNYFTGMPTWNEALELLKCQRYLYFVGSSSILNVRYDGSNLCINFKTPTSFVNKPSIIHNNAIFGVTSFNDSYESHNVSDFTVNSYGGGNINIIKPSSNPTRYGMAIVVNGFYLDAESY